MDTKNNSGTDIDVLTKFQPMPKRFMVWDKITEKFNDNGRLYDWREIAYLLYPSPLDTRDGIREREERYIIVQSTNLFDEDDEEIFEGSVVRDFDDVIGVVYYDREDGQYRAKCSNGDRYFQFLWA